MIFRDANIADIKQIQRVRHSVKENVLSNPALVTDKDVEEFISCRGKGWVCEVENNIVGFAIADLKENNVWALFVQSEFEQKGIGKKLHAIMLDWYFSQTKENVWLGTAPNTRAATFYKMQAWKEVGTHRKGEIKFEMSFDNWSNSYIKNLSSHIQASFHLCNTAFSELWCITQTPNTEEEYKLATSHPLQLYGVSLQYFFIMEYTKLLEEDKGGKYKYVSSIEKLSKKIFEFADKDSVEKLNSVKEGLLKIKSTDLYKKIKKLRDQKFAHSDNDSINNPLCIKGFSGEEILECMEHLKLILHLMNICFNFLEYEFGERIPNDTRTANFIRYQSIYKKYYYAHYFKALEEGYILL